MRMVTRAAVLFIAALMSVTAGTGTASAASVTIDWLNMAPTPFGSSVPNNSVFNLPGVGNVTVTYSIPNTFTDSRTQNACLQNGSIVSGPDTYSWISHELFATVLNTGPDPLVPVQWTITYTFPSTLPAGSVYVGIAGLGATTSFGGGASTATVNQNGTFLGDWSGARSAHNPWRRRWWAEPDCTAPGGRAARVYGAGQPPGRVARDGAIPTGLPRPFDAGAAYASSAALSWYFAC